MKLKLTTGNTALYFDTASRPKPESGYMLDGHRPLYFPDEKTLCSFFADICGQDTAVYVSGWMRSDIDTAILICLNSIVPQLLIQQQLMHAVLAQALPIFGHASLQSFVMTHMRQCLESGIVNIQPLALSNTIPTVSASGLARLIENNQRTIRKNNDIRIIRSAVDKNFFNMQQRFSKRFGLPIGANEERVQHALYQQHGFFVNTYFCGDTAIAHNLCYVDAEQKTFYDLSLPWLGAYKKHRIGYYSIIKNLMEAYQKQYAYCLGGGYYAYKQEIIWYFLPGNSALPVSFPNSTPHL